MEDISPLPFTSGIRRPLLPCSSGETSLAQQGSETILAAGQPACLPALPGVADGLAAKVIQYYDTIVSNFDSLEQICDIYVKAADPDG